MSMPPGRNLFKELKKDHSTFIETGSYRGDGIQLALEAGFEEIHSIDIDPSAIEFCRSRFDMDNPSEQNTKINLHLGDSLELLPRILNNQIPYLRFMFWLDAHWQMIEGTLPGDNPFPLLHELDMIRQHAGGSEDHTIIIDDILHLTHPDVTGWKKHDIEGGLKTINSKYLFTYYANPVINNILVAEV